MAEEKPSVGNLWNREPTLILATLRSGLMLAILFGLALTEPQIAGLLLFIELILALWTRQKMTPVAKLPADVRESLK